MSEWVVKSIKDLGIVITGKTPSKNHPEDWGDEYCFITPSDYYTYNKYASSSIRYLSNLGANRQKNKLLPKYSLLVTCIGSDMGKVVINAKSVITNQQINALVPNKDIADYNFLYYLFKNSVILLKILGSDGTAVPILNKTDFENIEYLIPPLPEQKAIADVLSALDDKIDLLQRQNETLEKMAETLFRQWFIEEAKEDWEEVTLKDICEIKNGYAFKSSSYIEKGYPIIRTMNFKNHKLDNTSLVYIDHEEAKKYEKFNLKRKDFLLVMVGASLGNYAVVTENNLPILQNQNMWCFRTHENIYQYFLNNLMPYIIEENIASASGSAREFFQKSAFYEISLKLPSKESIQYFDNCIDRIFSKLEINQRQIQTLQNLRDTLLPKLMSGEVRVKLD